MLVELSWPLRALSPNYRSRSHWPRTNAAKKARHEAYWSARLMDIGPLTATQADARLAFVITAYPPDKHHRDDDNLIASVKPYRDGIADALGVDDSRFDTRLQWAEPVKGGKLVVEVKAA